MSDSNATITCCPKCRAPLPEGLYQQADAICPACGLVFAKYRAAQDSTYRAKLMRNPAADEPDRDGLLNTLLEIPDSVTKGRFYAGVLGFLIFFIWGAHLTLLDYRTGAINQSFLHGPLLIFHEAGHVIFRILGEFISVLGGTLGQLIMPVVMMIALIRNNQDTLGASLALWLFGVSLLDVAPYIYDALDPQLVLLNGATGEDGGHDWIYLLGKLNLLEQAHFLGGVVHALGVLTLGLTLLWSFVLLQKQWRVVYLKQSPVIR